MNNIDISNWLNFRIGDIFETIEKGKQVPTGASVPKVSLKENGSIPRVSVSGINNGIIGYYDYNGDLTNNYRVYNNFVSVSFLKTVFYHNKDASLDMKVHCLKPKNVILNKYSGQFLVTAIRSSLTQFSYADQISSKVLPNLYIKLPATTDLKPDWNYMEQYMKEIESKVNKDINFLKNALGTL